MTKKLSIDWIPYYRNLIAFDATKVPTAERLEYFSNIFGTTITRDQLRHATERALERFNSLVDRPVTQIMPYYDKYRDIYDGKVAAPRKDFATKKKILKQEELKTCVIADLHIPFQNETYIDTAVKAGANCQILAVVADFLDVYSQSSFDKSLSVPFEVELDNGTRILEYLSEMFPWIILLEANHEDRVRRQLERNLPTELLFLADSHVLEHLASPFPNIEVVSDNFWFQIHDVVYIHPQQASSIDAKIPATVYERLREWDLDYGMAPYSTVVVAHTHHMSTFYRRRCKVIELGCMANPLDYAMKDARMRFKHPQNNGFALLRQINGETDWNNSREYEISPDWT